MNLVISLAIGFLALVPLSVEQKPIAATNAWVKAPADGATSTQAFAIVENPTMYDVYVVSATTDVAAGVQFERGPASSDTKPQAVTEITAPAYGSVELKPEGIHMVLTGLKKALKPGDTVTLTLVTDSGVQMTVDAEVRR